MDRQEQIQLLEAQIAGLPQGYISTKNIGGKARHYLQWKENSKVKSEYIRPEDLEQMQEKIERRRSLQAELRSIKAQMKPDAKKQPAAAPPAPYQTNVVTGVRLKNFIKVAKNWQRRDCFDVISAYFNEEQADKVCLLFGLRRTGKTTLLRQSILDLSPQRFRQAAYIKLKRTDTMAMMNRDLDRLYNEGYRYVFVDEVTLMEDFIDGAALFSDVYAAMGMKIVLSGTDSLGFYLAADEELYDRARMIHTTFISYREYARILGIHSIDEYIRYGGTLKAGEPAFGESGVNAEESSFRDNEATRKYIDTAICRNIQHSLKCYEDGGHFRHLYDLYETGDLTGAINRIIEDMNHRFVLSILTKDFVSHDLRLSARNLRNDRDADRRSVLLDEIDTEAVTQRLMEILEIRNRDEQQVGITAAHIREIKEYLKALDLIVDCPIESADTDDDPQEHILFTQPGMRYCQAQALVYSLMKDRLFMSVAKEQRDAITQRILEEVRGRMMEDIVLLETMKALPGHMGVCKLQFLSGEFDMVVYDEEKSCCAIYEIKHSSETALEQYRHLIDEEKCQSTQRRFGAITERIVLYRGEDMQLDNGVSYRNVEEYLSASATAMAMAEPGGPDFQMTIQ